MKEFIKKYHGRLLIGFGILLVLSAGFIARYKIEDYFERRHILSLYNSSEGLNPIIDTLFENKKMIRNNPANDSAWYSLGQGYYGLKIYDKAIESLKKAVGAAPDVAHYWGFLGKVHQAKKDYSAARDAYIQALRLNPDSQNNYIVLAWLYYFRLDPEKNKAFEVLKQGLQKFPEDKEILFDIARFYLYDKNEAEFRKYAPRYLKLDPGNQLIKDSYEKGIK